MRIPLFAHDANPAIDRPLCYESRTQVLELMTSGKIILLKDARRREWAAQFLTLPEHTLQAQLRALLHDHAEIEAVARWYDGPMGRGNILAFAKIQNRLCYPERHHYTIGTPADDDLAFLRRFVRPGARFRAVLDEEPISA